MIAQTSTRRAHIQMTPRYLMERIIERDEKFAGECVHLADGRPATKLEAIDYLATMIHDGYEVIPCNCQGTDAKGRCPGWQTK